MRLPRFAAFTTFGAHISVNSMAKRKTPKKSKAKKTKKTAPAKKRVVKKVAARPAPQGLDQHGRQAPVNNSLDDDQLEIPAFLRRQAH